MVLQLFRAIFTTDTARVTNNNRNMQLQNVVTSVASNERMGKAVGLYAFATSRHIQSKA